MKEKIVYNIKDRVVRIAQEKGINMLEFFNELGLSYGNFKGVQKQSALSSDALAMILSVHKDISPAWLLVGEGEMFRDAVHTEERNETYLNAELEGVSNAVIHSMQRVISSQEVTIKSQEKTIAALEKHLTLLEREITLLRKD
ncbi:hypothetical protein [Sphingobacterium yanglingense]|uniref:Uncharacterized protein n=1 Tax=Sphingobacterium yanglingense TaxID=1437280 RepID=A0A4R6W8Q4_9SPHI|nr:hypothetical protein [Sphingobacterium yanglingense]TDQ75426.1 hypothetical protein CLV99_4031 [Sphingobacterium yanglingense]